MRCDPAVEDVLLSWLGWISLCVALFGALISLADPVGLMVPFAALLLAGISCIAGNLRFVWIAGVLVAATIVAVALIYPPAPPSSTGLLLGFIVVMFSPAYLIAWVLTILGRRRMQSRALPTPQYGRQSPQTHG